MKEEIAGRRGGLRTKGCRPVSHVFTGHVVETRSKRGERQASCPSVRFSFRFSKRGRFEGVKFPMFGKIRVN